MHEFQGLATQQKLESFLLFHKNNCWSCFIDIPNYIQSPSLIQNLDYSFALDLLNLSFWILNFHSFKDIFDLYLERNYFCYVFLFFVYLWDSVGFCVNLNLLWEFMEFVVLWELWPSGLREVLRKNENN